MPARRAIFAFLFSSFILQPSSFLQACPFCNAVQPSFAERRAEADALVVAEATENAGFAVRQVLDGAPRLGNVEHVEAADFLVPAGRLSLLLGRHDPESIAEPWRWSIIAVDETSLAYYVRAPAISLPAAERLPYFIKYLEHADRDVADDAFREFGRAPFDAVEDVAPGFPFAKLRKWLTSSDVLEERKGFYGLALGLTDDPTERAANVALLRRLAADEASDFRAGFDGILGGLLWADGVTALDLIDRRFLNNPQAAEGDVRHVQRALRFYLEYGRAIPAERVLASVALLLERPGTAAEALADLSRRKDWRHVARAEQLFLAAADDDPALDRAVVTYLLLCPQPAAQAALRKLKTMEPERTQEALRRGAILGVRE